MLPEPLWPSIEFSWAELIQADLYSDVSWTQNNNNKNLTGSRLWKHLSEPSPATTLQKMVFLLSASPVAASGEHSPPLSLLFPSSPLSLSLCLTQELNSEVNSKACSYGRRMADSSATGRWICLFCFSYLVSDFLCAKYMQGDRPVAQQSRALAALIKDRDSISNTQKAAHSCL